MKRTSAVVWGLILIAAGALVILKQQNLIDFGWGVIWPLSMIFISIAFHIECFASKGKNYGLLVPGGILLIYGALFLYCEVVSWDAMSVLWPVFILGPGFGLLELKLFSGGKQGSWLPVLILFTIGGIFLVTQTQKFTPTVVIAAALIVMGLGILASSIVPKGRKSKTINASPKQNEKSDKSDDDEADTD